MFHNFDNDGKSTVKDENGHYLNSKYVDRATGQYEVVLDKNNRIIEEETNAGTFNYYDPEKLWGYHHLIYDIDPYTDYGNGGKDKTDYNTRKYLSFLTRFSGKLLPIDIFGIRSKSQNAFKAVEKNIESKKYE